MQYEWEEWRTVMCHVDEREEDEEEDEDSEEEEEIKMTSQCVVWSFVDIMNVLKKIWMFLKRYEFS